MKVKHNILINAYAIGPNRGSELGTGWNWVTNIAKSYNVYLIAEAAYKNDILIETNKLVYKENLHYYFIDIGDKTRKICNNQGDWRFYLYYRIWQKQALNIARKICTEVKIDLLHQLNMSGYREPGLMWKIKEIPLIWGPISGFGTIPFSYIRTFPLKQTIVYTLKNIINNLQYYLPNIQKSINHSSALIAANSESERILKKFRKSGVYMINETGSKVIDDIVDIKAKSNQAVFKICWIGKDVPRKALGLALKVIQKTANDNFEINIVGIDTNQYLNYQACHAANIINHGILSHQDSQRILASSHVLLFTSLHEGTPHVVLEAISHGVPVICHDCYGQGNVVNSKCGIKIPLKNPENSIIQFAKAINLLSSNRILQYELAKGALIQSKEITWEKNNEKMMKIYVEVLLNNNS